MFEKDYVLNTLKNLPLMPQLNRWCKQINQYKQEHIHLYPNLKDSKIKLICQSPKPTINFDEEAKYFYNSKLIGENIDKVIDEFNRHIKISDNHLYGFQLHKLVDLNNKLLMGGLLTFDNAKNWKFNKGLLEDCEKTNKPFFEYVENEFGNNNDDASSAVHLLGYLIDSTYISKHLANVILDKLENNIHVHCWEDENKNLEKTNMNLFILQLFNRGMYYNYEFILKLINKKILDGGYNSEDYTLFDLYYIYMFKLWKENTFSVGYVSSNPTPSPITKMISSSGYQIHVHLDTKWKGKNHLSESDINEFLTDLNKHVPNQQTSNKIKLH